MRLFNTLGRQLEEFKPQQPPHVKLYSCGPTVYDYAHIGNLRAYVFNDTLRRALEFCGFEVTQVVNITDVGHLTSDEDEGEDKLQAGAAREAKNVWQVADFYAEAFKKDVAELNILPPNGYKNSADGYARATDFIEQQQEIVKRLVDKSFAYQTVQAIYFDVSKLADYGKLTSQKLSEKEVAARTEVVSDKSKRHPQDFALWFFKDGRFANHEMSWPSPWGEGFPGWHLECSAIVHSTLGEPLDIHTGGVDHIGTHHTNEIAQTEAAFGHPLAKYWLHNEYLLADGQRMAKSAKNFVTLQTVKAKGFQPLALRLLFLQSHYRSQTNFTWEALTAAQQGLQTLYAWADRAKQEGQSLEAPKLLNEIKSAISEDLNTAKALAALSQADAFKPTEDLLSELDEVLGLGLAGRPDISSEQKQLITNRETARQKSDFSLADKLRQDLLHQKLQIKDTDDGPIWSRLD